MASTTGTAPIKAEYLLPVRREIVPDDDLAEGSTNHPTRGASDTTQDQDTEAHGGAPQKLTGAQRRKIAKEEKRKRQGANKGRRWNKVHDEVNLCWRLAAGQMCEFGAECRYAHDIPAYLSQKPRDLRFPPISRLSHVAPFVSPAPDHDTEVDADYPTVDFHTSCPIHEEVGYCRFGLKCRFLGGHARKIEDGSLELEVDEERKARAALTTTELNYIGSDVMKALRTKKACSAILYPRPITEAYLQELQESNQDKPEKNEVVEEDGVTEPTFSEPVSLSEPLPPASPLTEIADSQKDTPDVPMRLAEKKRLHWREKAYLAPLTTVGNLPFRRLCVSLGADITCGEMGLATSFLTGSKEEWSLVRRHPSESTFGVQIAGSKPATMVAAAEVIGRECRDTVDFVDINCGCPIDLVFKTGSGSALLESPSKLSKIIVGMNRALGEIPLTVKLRTGVKEGRNNAHKLMPRLLDSGVSAMTLHGRTRQQRYAKLADWDYIKQCVAAVRAKEEEENLPPVPIFGGGDCFSSQDFWQDIEHSGVDSVMVARGALIKPWIFTEIKERREWDISSRERLELIRKYAEFGLHHFGSDTAGINTTRRYLCEALSFQYRYVPIGLLEVLPGKLNDRPPAFRGRDDLETLLASDNSADWVKISEWFLGPAPESWTFTPKHKSNSYESQG
ncbi:zinc finger dihydrouridine synthase [Punctularia strigosozonata HHB-11173 SS5]|uniref:zinc finger dihydrouridine synthase n=1 Tax=Punctularia strigosozonata (strain HHB-11173) TaxID=741275 RepID=UPI00044175AE|nr:zinc finger dihydrouridine synthase [Punctularia strigosozonata HHB-11173 SS5]EIN14460.1 zinc finger dihydrouridine synthase [Punctularia strigosozonata HHB-11173 SS5]